MLEGRKFSPMRLKPFAWLSLAALLGCNGTPGLPSQVPHAAPPGDQKVQSLVTTTIMSASVSESALQAVELMVLPLTLKPIAEDGTIPVIGRVYFKRDATNEDLYEPLMGRDGADVVADVIPTLFDPASLIPKMTFQRGATPAVTVDILPGTFPTYQAFFPKSADGATSVAAKPGSGLVFAVEAAGGKYMLPSEQTFAEDDFTVVSDLKDASVAFKVTDAQGQPVTGLTKEYFHLFVYPKSDLDYEYHRVRGIHAFEDLSEGQYRITHTFKPSWQGETTRFRIEVVNPETTQDAIFYRR